MKNSEMDPHHQTDNPQTGTRYTCPMHPENHAGQTGYLPQMWNAPG